MRSALFSAFHFKPFFSLFHSSCTKSGRLRDNSTNASDLCWTMNIIKIPHWLNIVHRADSNPITYQLPFAVLSHHSAAASPILLFVEAFLEKTHDRLIHFFHLFNQLNFLVSLTQIFKIVRICKWSEHSMERARIIC